MFNRGDYAFSKHTLQELLAKLLPSNSLFEGIKLHLAKVFESIEKSTKLKKFDDIEVTKFFPSSPLLPCTFFLFIKSQLFPYFLEPSEVMKNRPCKVTFSRLAPKGTDLFQSWLLQ